VSVEKVLAESQTLLVAFSAEVGGLAGVVQKEFALETADTVASQTCQFVAQTESLAYTE
jgi:hypothetical protein